MTVVTTVGTIVTTMDANIALFVVASLAVIVAPARYATALRWLTGCVLVGLGLRLALSGRQ